MHATILEAAEAEFLRYGFRKTSMEGIARAAGAAKATVYAHFKSKPVVFDAVCAAQSDRVAALAREAATSERDPCRAAAASMRAKFSAIYDVVERSPHAAELIEASLDPGNAETQRAHHAYVAEIAALLQQGLGLKKKKALALAEVAELSCEGVLRRSESREAFSANLALLLEHLFS